MTDVATLFPPQTYSSSFFLNGIDEEDSSKLTKRGRAKDRKGEDSTNFLDCFLNKMLRALAVVLALTQIVSVNSQCIDDANPKYRTFKSIVEYQGNKIPFDPKQEGSEGNYVKFVDGIINVLSKNTFVTMDSDHVYKLQLDNHQIHTVEDGAFLSLNCVTTLNLSRNDIKLVTKNTFEGLRHLHFLDLSQNALGEIPDHAFQFNPLLKKMNVSRNRLQVVHPESFFKLLALEELDVTFNYLHKISPDAFQYFDKLLNLQMGFNEFDYLDAEKWHNLTSLKVLNLSNNQLKSIDFLYDFSFGSTLTELYLNDNYLTRINVYALRKHLPSLRSIDISRNPWLCADLLSMIAVFNDSRISYNGSETTLPNYFGISCNHSVEDYSRAKWTEPVSISTTTTTTTPLPPTEQPVFSSSKILDSLQNLHTIIVCLFVVISLFIVVEVMARCGWLNFMSRRQHRAPMMDDQNVEDLSLLRGRF